eukprot:scaffold14754_cov348-Ochromonas_danica.AAC.1
MINLLTSAASVNRVNKDGNLPLSSSIMSKVKCNASWTVSGVLLRDGTLSTTHGYLLTTKAIPANQLTIFSLTSLSPSSLNMVEGSTFTFNVRCGESSLALSVSVNAPPRSGRLSVDPHYGQPFDTAFFLYTDLWWDEDLPLLYEYSFLYEENLGGELYLPLSKWSEIAYTYALLPVQANGSVFLQVAVSARDDLGAESNRLYQTVAMDERLPGGQTNSTLSEIISSLLIEYDNEANSDVSKLLNVLSASVASLNVINCSASPNCADLHRSSCHSIANTCGSCLSGYVSVEEDENNNNPCISYAEISQNFSTATRKCSSSQSCPSWQYCYQNTGLCVDRSKTCNSPTCSGHGKCNLVSASNASKLVPSCSLLSASCEAICKCGYGYGGSTCSVKTSELAQAQSVRSQLIYGLSTVVEHQALSVSPLNSSSSSDLSRSSLLDFAYLMAEIVRNEDDISSKAVALFIRSLANYLSSEALQVNTDFYLEVADVLDPVYTAVTDFLFTSSSNSSSSSAVVLSVLSNILSDSSTGSYSAVYDGIRVTSYVYESTGSSSSQVITIPIALTTQEQLLLSTGQLTTLPTVTVTTAANSSSSSVAVVVTDQSAWSSANVSGTLNSNVVVVKGTNVEYVD